MGGDGGRPGLDGRGGIRSGSGEQIFAANHDNEAEGANGLWIRHVYLTYDVKQSDNVSMRVRFESSSPGLNSASDKMKPSVKDAYLAWAPNGSKHVIYLGLSGSPTFNSVESAWGYRAVEKTPVDLYRMGGTRDSGLGLKGELSDRFDYQIMVANGGGTSSESNKGKKYMASVGLDLTADIQVRANFDYTTIPPAPCSAARTASAGDMIPLITIGRPVIDANLSRSPQVSTSGRLRVKTAASGVPARLANALSRLATNRLCKSRSF